MTLLLTLPVFCLVILTYLTMIATAILAGPARMSTDAMPIALGIVFGVFGLLFGLFMPALRAGVFACFREGLRSGRMTAQPLWSGFRQWWACTWVCWAAFLAVLLSLPFCFLLVGFLLIPAIGLLAWLALFRITDKNLGGIEAITFAWRALQGRFWMMLVYSLLVSALMGAGVMGMYIGLFFSVPFGIACYAVAYEALRRKVEGAPPAAA